MNILITGAAGFLGHKLATTLLKSDLAIDRLTLVDITEPNISHDKVVSFVSDLSDQALIHQMINAETDIVYHLAAIVSGHAEKDFDLGWKVNLDLTRNLLERCKAVNPKIKFVFTSSCAVYGGDLPPVIDDLTILTPQSSYGTQKAMCEMLINDYTRKGYIDGRSLRLPTICVRPGKANQAASSFVSGIIREPINEQEAICPVDINTDVWISRPDTVVDNILNAAFIEGRAFGKTRAVALPGITVSVKDMIASLRKICGDQIADRIVFKYDEFINSLVSTWPTRIDNAHALQLGFKVDGSFDGFIRQYIDQYKS